MAKIKKVKKVESWQSSDGDLFDNEQDAWEEQTKINLSEAFVDNPVLGTSIGCVADLDHMLEWINLNADAVMQYVEARNHKRIK